MILDADGRPVMPGRRLQDLSAEELRAKLYVADVEYPKDATKAELIALVVANKL